MKPSLMLRRFLDSGKRPITQRDQSALLDESRSLLVSQLPTTAVHIQNLTQGDIEGILAGGREGIMDRAAAVHRAAQSKPAAKPDRIYELCAQISAQAAEARKPLHKPAAKPATAPAPANRFKTCSDSIVQQAATHRSSPPADRAEAKAELEARGFTVTASGIISKSFRKS